jgi:hypothetical protein
MKTKHTAGLIAVVLVFIVGAIPGLTAQAQQYPNPTTTAEVPGPAAGNTMTKEYVQMVGRMGLLLGLIVLHQVVKGDTNSTI